MTDKRVVLSVVLVLTIGVVLALYMAWEPQRQTLAAERQQREAIDRGGALYSGLCANCHGQSGEGGAGPAIVRGDYLARYGLKADSADDLRKATDAMRKAIARGRIDTAMPAWDEDEGGSLNREEIYELATFLLHGTARDWERAQGGGSPDSRTPPSAGVPSSDLEAGKKLYSSKGCIGCHGPSAEGGVGPALGGLAEERFFAQVRKPDGKMPAYTTGQLSDEELRKIVQYLESLK